MSFHSQGFDQNIYGNQSKSSHKSENRRQTMCETINQRTLDVIDEDEDKEMPGCGQPQSSRSKRATMVKKSLSYFSDTSSRSVSEDNLYTRRKNLAVHLGLDEKIGVREIQKINTYSLPVPGVPFEEPSEPAAIASKIEVVKDDLKVKDLVRFLGIKDGFTSSMSLQGSLSENPGDRQSTGSQISQTLLMNQKKSRPFEKYGSKRILERSMKTDNGLETRKN